MRIQFHNGLRRLVSLLLALAMLLPNFPILSFAEEMDADTGTSCGSPAHIHGEDCFRLTDVAICGFDEGQIHTHEEACFQDISALICGQEENAVHSHGEACYEIQSQCICPLDEETPHTHAESCYSQENTLICEQAEHTHGTECYPMMPLANEAATDISTYTADLHVYNNIRYSNASGEATATYTDILALTSGEKNFEHDMIIGAHEVEDENSDKKPMPNDIHMEFAGLSMEGKVTVNPVYPENPDAYKTTLNVTGASKIGSLTLSEGAVLEITLNASLSVGTLDLGENSKLTITADGNTLTLTDSVSGTGALEIQGGTVSAGQITCGDLAVSSTTLTAESVHANDSLTIMQANVTVSKTITASGSITAANASIANASLFGVATADSPVTMTFTGITFTNVARVGAADNCAVPVYFANDSSVSNEAASYQQDFTITYQVDGITEPSHYRVMSGKLNGEDAVIVSQRTLPEYQKDGYTFLGWKIADDAEPIKELTDGLTGNLVLTPATDAENINVIMNLMFLPSAENCDNADVWNEDFPYTSNSNTKYSQQSVKLDSPVTLKKPQRFGYQFIGWRLKGTDIIVADDSLEVTMDKLTDKETFVLELEAQWEKDGFPLYWTFSKNVPLANIEISLDGGSTWATPGELASKYPEYWTWYSDESVLRSENNAEIIYGETLDAYLKRLGQNKNLEWQFPVVRDTRFDAGDPDAQAFLNWSTKASVVSSATAFDAGVSGLLVKPADITWEQYQNTTLPLSDVVILTANFGTANYNLEIPNAALNQWSIQVNGTTVTPVNGELSVLNGAKVTLSCARSTGLSICNWAFSAQNNSLVAPEERVYDGGTHVYYDFTMPACDVTATYQTSFNNLYADIAGGAITFAEDVDPAGTGITRDGFWYDGHLASGESSVYKLPLLGMTPLCYVEGKGYFYVWNMADALYVTSDGVATTNQLTLVGTAKIYFNAVNLSPREAYIANAKGRTIYGESVEKPRDSAAAGSMDTLYTKFQEKGGLAPLGNIVLANDAAVKQTFTLTFLGQNNYVAAVFSDQYYYSANNTLTIQGSGTAALSLGTALANCSFTIKNIAINGMDTACDYLVHAIAEGGTVAFDTATVIAPKKEVYVKNASLSLSNKTSADFQTIVAGTSMSVGEGCKLRVRGNVYCGYAQMSVGKNSVTVIDGNYLINYYHWNSDNKRGAAGAYLIVKGNRCELGNVRWTAGTIICNTLVFGRCGGIEGGTVIANQITNPPMKNWEISSKQTEYQFTKDSHIAAVTANGDTYPFTTYSQNSSTIDVFRFSGGNTYLLGYSSDGTYDPNILVENTPVKEILEPLLDENGDYNGSVVNENIVLESVKNSSYKSNECFVLGNSTYTTSSRTRTVEFSGNAKLYAAGNITLLNDTTVTENAEIWCGGRFGSKNELSITGGSVTAKDVGIAYDLTTELADGTLRWKKLTINNSAVTADRVGTLSTCASSTSKVLRGAASIDVNCLKPNSGNTVQLEFDEYVNYLLGTAGFTNPEENEILNSVHISGSVKDSMATYSAESAAFAAPTYDGGSGTWKLNTAAGDSVDGVDTNALLTYNGTSLTTAAYADDRLILVAAKDRYNITVKAGEAYVTDVNGQGSTVQAVGEAGKPVTITVTDPTYAADKTVVWYTDANGYLRNPGYIANGNTITFTMPYNDVEVFVAPEGIELDLSKHHVTITSDGFWTELEGKSADREFHYTGSLTIAQSMAAETDYRIRVLADVDNLSSERSFILTAIHQKETYSDIGLLLEDSAQAEFLISGSVELCRTEVTENSEIILKGLDTDREKNVLYIHHAPSFSAVGNNTALGNDNGKIGDITLENLRIKSYDGKRLPGFCHGETKNANSTVAYIDCSLNASDWYSSSKLAQNVGEVLIEGCEIALTSNNSWPSYLFNNCDNVWVKDSDIDFLRRGGTCSVTSIYDFTFGVKKTLTIDSSNIKTALNTNGTATLDMRVNVSNNAPTVILQGNTVYTSEDRMTFRNLTLKDSSTLNMGTNLDGYLFADNITVQDNATINANTVLVSGFLTAEVANKNAVLANLSSTSPSVKNGSSGGLFISGGTVNAKNIGGDVNSTVNISGGSVNAERIGTMGALYGYATYIPKAGEEWCYTYSKIPVGATVNISGAAVVNVSDYLGGMNAAVNISGGKVNLADNAVLGMKDSQADALKAYYTSVGQNIDEQQNISVNISGGKVEGDGSSINVPYGDVTISGENTGVKVGNILAHYGDITILTANRAYDNPGDWAEHGTVGVYVADTLNGQFITIGNDAVVYAQNAIATAPLAGDTAKLDVSNGFLYAGTVGTDGAGAGTVLGEENVNIFRTNQQVSILYVLNDDITDPASHNNPDSFTYVSGNPVTLEEAERYGYVFKGWYDSAEKALQMKPEEALSQFYSNGETVTLYAAWVPKTVAFQVQINGNDFTSIGLDMNKELQTLPAGTATYDETTGILTFTKNVEVSYRELIRGSGQNNLKLTDFDLGAYSSNSIEFADGSLTGEIQINSTVTREILDYYAQKGQPIVLKVSQLIKKNEDLSLHLNQNQTNGRPVNAHFLGQLVGKNTLIGSAVVGSTISTATALMVNGELNKPVAPGYSFTGWYTTSEPGATDVAIDKNYIVGGGNSLDFYAHWEQNPYKIQFDSDGGFVTKDATEPTDGTTDKLDAYIYYDAVIKGNLLYDDDSEKHGLPYAWKPGYKFSHWAVNGVKVDGQELNQSAFSAITADSLEKHIVTDSNASSVDPVLILTAVYTPITVTYHTEGGTFTEAYLKTVGFTHVEGEIYTSQTNGNTVAYGKPLAGYSTGTDTEFTVLSTTAKYYQENQCYIDHDYREDIGRKGWTFGGWATEQGGNDDIGTLPAYADIELWAKWTPNTYTLKLHAQDDDGSEFSSITAENPEPKKEVEVTVGKIIDGTANDQTDVKDHWPDRDTWYASAKTSTDENKRFILGFTFHFLDPGAPNGEEGSAQKTVYTRYASNITSLINHDTLFTKVETIEENGKPTEGSKFFLPDSDDYENILLGDEAEAVPDYPDGSTIPMYAVYRERSVVFIERYVDLDGNLQETVLSSESYLSYSEFANSYRDNEEIAKKFKDMGYTFVYWSVNHPQGNTQYPSNANQYTELRTQWMTEANSLGCYDINVYTVYAAQVSASITLETAQNPTAENAVVKEYPIPGSMALKDMVYSAKNGSTGLKIVSKEELDQNRYDPAHVEDVAIFVELVNSSNEVKKNFWIENTAENAPVDIAVGAGWTIRMTLYHSRIIPANHADLSFLMQIGFLTKGDQGSNIIDPYQMIGLTTNIDMKPTLWTVNYKVDLPTDELHRKILNENGFSATEENTRVKTDVNWTYGANLQSLVPDVEGFDTDGKWKYSESESFSHGTSGKMTLTDSGSIALTSGYLRKSYTLTNSTNGKCDVNQPGQIPYHDTVQLTPKDTDPALIWLKYDGQFYRLDELTQEEQFYAEETNGIYNFLMPPGDVEVIYNDVLELYLGYGTIDIDENGYKQNGRSVSWPGNYKILQWPAEEEFVETPNVLNLAGDLSARTIALGKLDISSNNSIKLEAGAKANLTAGDAITAKNILVQETAELCITGNSADTQVTLSPESEYAAIGGYNGLGGSIKAKDLDLTMNMPAGSAASGIGAGTVTVESCDVVVNERFSSANGAYRGTWFGGSGSTVTIKDSTVNSGAEAGDNASICDGETVTFFGSAVGSSSSRIVKHSLKGNNIYVNHSDIYLDSSSMIALSPDTAIHVDKDSTEGSTIDVIYSEELYRGSLLLYKAVSDVAVNDYRLLDLNNGDIQITDSGSTQGSVSLTHGKKYQLMNWFANDYESVSSNVAVTGELEFDIRAETDCEIKKLTVNANMELTPLSIIPVETIEIASKKTLTVDASDNTGLRISESFGGAGNYSQEDGSLSSTADLTVGGDMTLTRVTVSADGKNIGSHGAADAVTTVTIDGGSIQAETIGACGVQSETFTFVVQKNNPAITGKVVQDHYRLSYNLTDTSFQKENGVPVGSDGKKLSTVLRSSTEYSNGTARSTEYQPEVPGEPKYTGNSESYFTCWYLLKMGEKVALSTSTVAGIDEIGILNADLMQYADAAANDGTRTLQLYAWTGISGTGVIGYGRILDKVDGSLETVEIESDGAWTARFDVSGASPENGSFTFNFREAIPAGTKLTLSCWKNGQVTYYYYVPTVAVTRVGESDFVRMGSGDESADLINTTAAFEAVLQLSADFNSVTANYNNVTLNVQLEQTSYSVASVSYTVYPKAAASCTATENTIAYSVTPGSDKRLNGQKLYLVAQIRKDGQRIEAPYDAVLALDGQFGSWLDSAVYFSLGEYRQITETIKSWNLTGLDSGSYSITWYLTAAEDAPNVFSTELARSDAAVQTVTKAPEPELSVTLVAPGNYVLPAGEAQELLFRYSTNGAVSVVLEKQTKLLTFTKIAQNIIVDAEKTTVTLPGEEGVYRVRFSLDDFTDASSDWDDVYFTFIVRNAP